MRIVINLPPVTKKNSQQILVNKATGRPFVAPSAKFKSYEKACAVFMPRMKDPINQPVNVKMLFYNATKRRRDLVNDEESCLDILVRYGVLADDNYNIVWSMDGSRELYDKTSPRTEIEITPIGESNE